MVNAPSYDTCEEPLQSLVPLRRSRESTQDQSAESSRRPPQLQQYNEMLASFLTTQQMEQARLLRQMGGDPSPSLLPPFIQQHHQQSQQAPPLPPYQYQPQHHHQLQQQQPPVRRSEPHHRVYVLRCSSCDAFLCDRGMRAVLLLKPHITLFSTDTAPVGCGPLYPGNGEGRDEPEELVERTCECLTQSLGCFNCGNVNGCECCPTQSERCPGANAVSLQTTSSHHALGALLPLLSIRDRRMDIDTSSSKRAHLPPHNGSSN